MTTSFTPISSPSSPHARQSGRAARWTTLAMLSGLALLTSPAQAAGQIELSFVQPETFVDIGRGSFDRETNLRSLGEHFKRLGAELPEGQRLQIEVLDVDLAGEIQPHTPQEVRVLRGGVDFPRMTLRYTLRAGDTVLAQGEDELSDASYMFGHTRSMDQHPLPYERRMLEAWFNERFGTHKAAAAR